MAKIILEDGTEEFLSPAAARAKVVAGEARFPEDPHAGYGKRCYKTRQMVAETPKVEKKVKRKRRTKAEIEADNAAAGDANED